MDRYRPHVGETSIFDVIETTPGHIDPRTGRFVESTALAVKDIKNWWEGISTSPGSRDPITGRVVSSSLYPSVSDRGRAERSEEEGSESRESRLPSFTPGRRQRPSVKDWRPRGEDSSEGDVEINLSGSNSVSKAPDLLLWTILGFGALLVLEATGVTKFTRVKNIT